MKRIGCWILMGLMLFMSTAFAENVVQLPDQYLSCMVWKSCQVQRQPGTEIVSLTEDAEKGIFSTFLGALSFDYSGDYTVYLVEYDTDTDTTYKTNVHVTVSPRDPTIESRWAQEDNSAKMQKWMRERGYIFAVGQQVSFRIIVRIDGVEQKMIYESNNPGVATVNANGLVTMHSPGRVSILVRAEGSDWAESFGVFVHDGEPWTNSWGDFEPEDNTETMNIYKQPDTASTVIAVKKKWDIDNFYVISRGEEWCKMCYDGKVGYVQTSKLSFYDHFEWDGSEEETALAPTGETAGESGQTITGSGTEGKTGQAASGKTDGKTSGKTGGKTVHAAQAPDGRTADLDGMTVKVLKLGLSGTDVQLNGETVTVASNLLTFDKNAPEGWNVAYIYTPRTGHCTLRKTASENGKAIRQCKAGTIVAVLEYGSRYSRIAYKGDVGYVRTDCLRTADRNNATISSGKLSYHGKATGSTTVNIRSAPLADSCKITEWPTGTDVIILSRTDGWTQIERNGICGFVMDEFVMDEESEINEMNQQDS